MNLHILKRFLLLVSIFMSCTALPWTQGYVKYGKNNFVYLSPNKFWSNGYDREPNCDELRAMWRYSMLKSRRTEMTNEIPNFKDPFAHNVWEPHARSRQFENNPTQESGFQGPRNHVYGKVVHTVPTDKYSDRLKVNGRSFGDMAKFLTSDKTITPRRKNAEAYRLPSGEISFRKLPDLNDSFRQLKALVKAQRAKELHDQQVADPSLVHHLMKDVRKDRKLRSSNPSDDYFYNGSYSYSGKRNAAAPGSLQFITNPFLFVYRPPKYYDQVLAQHYASDYGYHHKPYVTQFRMKYSNQRSRIPARY